MFKLNISKILEVILKYFREFIILALSVALIIVLLRGCEDEVQVLELSEKPKVRDSIIYVPSGQDLKKRADFSSDLDSLSNLLKFYRNSFFDTKDTNEERTPGIQQKSVSGLKFGAMSKHYEDLLRRVRSYVLDLEKIQEDHFQANFYIDTLRNDSIFLLIREEVAENRIQSRQVSAKFTLKGNKKRLQLYVGASGGYGKGAGSFGFHFTVLPKRQKFALSYYNHSQISFGNFTNSHNIAVHFRIRK